MILELEGETVKEARSAIGYLHTGIEKNLEFRNWTQGITFVTRMDYLQSMFTETAYCLAVEKLLGLSTPDKATWMRMCLLELNRIHSHLVWLGTSCLELGAISMFWYTFRERDQILDLSEMVCGTRMHTRYFQAGGLAEDIPDEGLRNLTRAVLNDGAFRTAFRAAPTESLRG